MANFGINEEVNNNNETNNARPIAVSLGNVVRLENGKIGIVSRIGPTTVSVRTSDETTSYDKCSVKEVLMEQMPVKTNVEGVIADKNIIDDIFDETTELLRDYDYDYNDCAVRDFLRDWNNSKANLRGILSKHPNWNEDTQMIVLKSENFKNSIDWANVREFMRFYHDRIVDYLNENEFKIGMYTYSEFKKIKFQMDAIKERMDFAMSIGIHCTYKGMDYGEVCSEFSRICNIISNANELCSGVYFNGDGYIVNKENAFTIGVVIRSYSLLNDIIHNKGIDLLEEDRLTQQAVDTFTNGYDCSAVPRSYIPQVGQALTKYIGKICRNIGADKFVDIQDKSFTDEHGVWHEKKVDMGYNHYRALLGDAMACKTFKDDVYISINAVDYLTMSLLYGTASCHTIDKENIRNVEDRSHVYSGCNSSGTVSDAIDNVSIVMYTIKRDGNKVRNRIGKEADPNGPIFRATKMRRMMLYLGEDKLCCSRLYPDGRDGGDVTFADQFRNIAQKVISDCLSVDNMWTLNRGSMPEVSLGSDATCYPDWQHCSDVSTSYLRSINGLLNYKGITVGHEPICLCCGNYHDTADNIICEECHDRYDYHCERCGDGFNSDDWDWIETEDGHYYCCYECAENDGYVQCEGGYWYPEDECFQDSYDDEWYHSDDYISVDDGEYKFYDSYNAESYGCVYDEFEGEWTYNDRDYLVEDAATGEWFIKEWAYDYVETDDGKYYYRSEDAIADGYAEDENGDWVLKEEMEVVA